MKVKTVDARPRIVGGSDSTARIVMVELSGPIDQGDSIFRRARELTRKAGASDMMKSFEWALANHALEAKK